MIQILALYFGFEGAKNIYVSQVLIWGSGGCWRFLTGVLHLDIDLDMVNGLQYAHFLYLDFEDAKNIHVLRVLNWGSEGCWSFLTVVLHPDLDSDMVTGL